MGTTRLYHKQWKTILYIDLRDVKTIELQIKEALRHSFLESGNKVTHFTLEHMKERFQRGVGYKHILLSSLGYRKTNYNEHNRIKRGWLNPIGEVANILFGTLSSKDAEYYNNEIDKLYANNKRINTLIANETTIVRSMLKNMNAFDSKINNYVEQLTNTTNDNLYRLNKREIVLESLLQLNEIISEHNELISNLRNIVVNGEQGKIDPLLVEPRQLTQILKTIEQKYGSNRMIFPITDEYAYRFLKSASINVFVLSSYKLCFEIRFPILEEEIYILYQMVPIPQLTSDYIYLLNTIERYILIEKNTRHFTYMSDTDVTNCLNIFDIKICERHSPSFTGNTPDPCIQKALHGLPASEEVCPMHMIKRSNSIWIQLHSNSEWIAMSYFPESLHITCEGVTKVKTYHIQGVNLVKIQPGCTGQTTTLTLFPSNTVQNTEETQLTLGFMNVSLVYLNDSVKAYARVPELTKELVKPQEIYEISRSLDEIVSEASGMSLQTRSISRNESTWMTVKGLLVALTLVLTIYASFKFKIWKLCGLRPCTYNNCYNTTMGGTHKYTTAPQTVTYSASANNHTLEEEKNGEEETARIPISTNRRHKKPTVRFQVPPL
ncbi:uncharacterized protein LOC143264767 [Megachile rotundata]|uniref:uncharacterized protein LOC143264767 n=1 Tax=Megachile rotundata TaxID=143995 RepID=UPI003FD5A57D